MNSLVFLQGPQIGGVRLAREEARPQGPADFANIEIAMRIDGETVRPDERSRRGPGKRIANGNLPLRPPRSSYVDHGTHQCMGDRRVINPRGLVLIKNMKRVLIDEMLLVNQEVLGVALVTKIRSRFMVHNQPNGWSLAKPANEGI